MLLRFEVLLVLTIAAFAVSCTTVSPQDQKRNNMEIVKCVIGGGCTTLTNAALFDSVQQGYLAGYQNGYDKGRTFCSAKTVYKF